MLDETSAQAEEESRPPETPRPRFRLKLDHDDVYFGCEELLAGEELALGADDVVLDHAPDNAPGQYRWLRDEKRFVPLPKAQQKTEPGAPTLEQAFYSFAKFGAESPRAKAWLDWYETTLDAFGTGPGK